MTEKRYMRMPPKFSELKKQAAEINDPIDKLSFWIDQKRQYIQESSWKMKEVTVFDVNDVYLPDDLKRRSGKTEITGKDHNLISIEAEIESLNSLHELSKSDSDSQLNDIELQAIDNVCLDAKRKDKRRVITQYAKLIKTEVKADIRELFKAEYDLAASTFYEWSGEYENELRSISRTKK